MKRARTCRVRHGSLMTVPSLFAESMRSSQWACGRCGSAMMHGEPRCLALELRPCVDEEPGIHPVEFRLRVIGGRCGHVEGRLVRFPVIAGAGSMSEVVTRGLVDQRFEAVEVSARVGSGAPRRARPSKRAIFASPCAIPWIRGLSSSGWKCRFCGLDGASAFTGTSVERVGFSLEAPTLDGRHARVEVALACRGCGGCNVRQARPAQPASATWDQFVGTLRQFAMADGRVPADPSSASAPPCDTAAPRPGPASRRSLVLPSRRDPEAAAISSDDLLDGVLAIRAARTWAELLRAMGVR